VLAPLDPDVASGLDTPVVVVDLDRVDARIGAMAAAMAARGVRLRPHTKTHKSLAFARRQVVAGAAGLTVATIGEAEVFADGGFEDLFIAYPVIVQGPKADRLRRLAERCRLSVGADSVEGIEALAAALGGGDGRPVPASTAAPRLVIEIDVGGARTGVRPDGAGPLARRAAELGLAVTGVFTHGGHGYAGRSERVAAAGDEVTGLAAAAGSLRAAGVDPTVVSAGSTPTAELSARDAVTEERPGTYIFGDRQQAFLADRPLDDTALLVAATVVSHGSANGFVTDSGAKILAKDVAPYLAGHGSVVGYPDAVISRVNDHHGVVELPLGADRPSIGAIVWIAPNHVCPVVNLVDSYVVAQGGRVVDRWPVDARGRNA
jgi:D-serine deaminase-like pyridoxal phosphate-dependent protein